MQAVAWAIPESGLQFMGDRRPIPMSRVERIEASADRRGAAQQRRSGQEQTPAGSDKSPTPPRTPGRAEGGRRDVEEALTHEQE